MQLNRQAIEAMIPADGAEYDVIVCGAGFAGLGAALAAAHNGAKTLLLEGSGVLGGVGQICLWMPAAYMCRPTRDDKKKAVEGIGGVHSMLVNRIKELGGDAYLYDYENLFRQGEALAIHPDYLQVAAYRALEDVGCHYRLYSFVTGVIRDGNTVRGVQVTDSTGTHAFKATVVIDATGNGDVAHLAGAEMLKGRAEDGKLMPATQAFVLGNTMPHRIAPLNTPAWHEEGNGFYRVISEAREAGYQTAVWYAVTWTSLPGVVTVNNGGPHEIGNIDGTDSRDLTLFTRIASRVATDFVEIAHRWKIPGLEHCCLLRVGSQVAVRETRRIVGDYALTSEDIEQSTAFEDTVAMRNERWMDLVTADNCRVKAGTCIPLRALLPRGIDGLMAVGRCASFTREAMGASRGMGTCMAIGQGAGATAAVACRNGTTPRRVDVAAVREALANMGVELPVAGEKA